MQVKLYDDKILRMRLWLEKLYDEIAGIPEEKGLTVIKRVAAQQKLTDAQVEDVMYGNSKALLNL